MGRALRIICGVALAVGLLGAQQDSGTPPQQQRQGIDHQDSGRLAEPETEQERSESQQNPEAVPENFARADLTAQIWMAIFAGLQVILTFAALIYIRRTLIETRRAVVEAASATEAAREAVEVTRLSAEAQLRGYISLEKTVFDWRDNRPRIELHLRNAGQTPIKRFAVQAAFDVCPTGRPELRRVPENIEGGRIWSDIGAGRLRIVKAIVSNPRELTRQSPFRRGLDKAHVRGRVIYQDIFDDVWQTEFIVITSEVNFDGRKAMSVADAILKVHEPYNGKLDQQYQSAPHPHPV